MSKTESKPSFNPYWLSQGYDARFQIFQNLMRFRIRNILLVSSLYDLFLFEEDGRLYELLREEFQGLNLTHAPELTRVSSGKEAIRIARQEKRFDLILMTLHIEEISAEEFARQVRDSELDLLVVLLVFDNRELIEVKSYQDKSIFNSVFLWQGDFRIIIAIIKQIEDRKNIAHDTESIGVQTIILIEDSVRYYSSFLTILYLELFKHSQKLIEEGINLSHKFLRMRARPKILLCQTYEEAWEWFIDYQETILGIISDIDFKRRGKTDHKAGLRFARNVKKLFPDIPVLLQSRVPENEERAHRAGAAFLVKNSPTLMQDLRSFMVQNFGFGDFVFRTEDGTEVGRASDLKSFYRQLRTIPEESLLFHGKRNHISNWLKSRTEFSLAHKLRPIKTSDYDSSEALRRKIVSTVRDYVKSRDRGIVTDFRPDIFDPRSSFSRIGGGSLGGKARGLSFINKLIYNYKIVNRFKGIKIYVPPCLTIGTDVFDQFLDENNLHDFALRTRSDLDITRKFVEAKGFPSHIKAQLRQYLEVVRFPLAVRSSSLLEDSLYQPFAGVYDTFMLPNNERRVALRLESLLVAIRRVYASTFFNAAKEYMRATSFRLEEEKMAIIIQKVIGSSFEDRYYPEFSGVAKSHNFYPIAPQQSNDGIVNVAVGLGKTIVDGGVSLRFSPKYPQHLPQFHSIDETISNSQKSFYALNLHSRGAETHELNDVALENHDLTLAEKDGVLNAVGSTYSMENNAIYDGVGREGTRLVTFAPILKHKIFPLPEIVESLLSLGSWAMGASVEIEFAANLSLKKGKTKEFGILQMRPLVLERELEALDIAEVGREKVICSSNQVLGNALIDNIHDIVFVDAHRFERGKSREVAREIGRFNAKLRLENTPYILITVGRLGTLDPWLGIPVKWEHISGARVIVEGALQDFSVAPSQGTHFFHNITSFNTGYFTVGSNPVLGYINWDWLLQVPSVNKTKFCSHLRFDEPVIVKMNGRQNKGIILKPECNGL